MPPTADRSTLIGSSYPLGRDYRSIPGHAQAKNTLHIRYSSLTVHCSAVICVIALSLLLLEQKESLSGLPFLIGVLSSGCLQKVVIIRDRRRLSVQCIVRCRPEKVRR